MPENSPWSRDECRKRYIEGEKITLIALSELSGVNPDTLKSWSKKEGWSGKRRDFLELVETKARDKVADKISDRLADEMSEVAIDHFNIYKKCRDIADLQLTFILERLQQAHKPVSHPELDDAEKSQMQDQMKSAALQRTNVMTVNLLSIVVDRSVRGERMSLGMEYDDINKAIAAVEKTGLQVIVPDDQTLAKLIHSQGNEQSPTPAHN